MDYEKIFSNITLFSLSVLLVGFMGLMGNFLYSEHIDNQAFLLCLGIFSFFTFVGIKCTQDTIERCKEENKALKKELAGIYAKVPIGVIRQFQKEK